MHSRWHGLVAVLLVAVGVIGVPQPAGAFAQNWLEFPATVVGGRSQVVRATVTNDSDVPDRIARIWMSGDTTSFAIDGGTCVAGDYVELAPGDSCYLEATFAPTQAGTRRVTVGIVSEARGYSNQADWTGWAATSISGYRMLDAGGRVYAFGDATHLGDSGSAPSPLVDIESTPSGTGYWTLDAWGRIFARGTARDFRTDAMGMIDHAGGERATSLSTTPGGDGLWVFTNTGRVKTIGAAKHLGDMQGHRLNGPVLDSIPTPTGAGYYMVASDGGIFTFGDAVFRGSMGAAKLNAPVQSLVPDFDSHGYWLVASDGGIFAFDAAFLGSMGGTPLNKPVTGMVRSNGGYMMVAEDGGIFSFGDAVFRGSLGDRPPASPIVAVAALV